MNRYLYYNIGLRKRDGKYKAGRSNAIDCKHLKKYLLDLEASSDNEIENQKNKNLDYDMPFLQYRSENKKVGVNVDKLFYSFLKDKTDEEINKLWGYDYKEDSSITEVDENTFYDIQKYDNSIGYSINFAIRETRGGELLGETIVYNITYDKKAEMGCRLMKKAWGKKLGAKAYRLTLEWAEKELGVTVIGKCFKDNQPSKKMITFAGLELFSEDDKFYYFKRKTT